MQNKPLKEETITIRAGDRRAPFDLKELWRFRELMFFLAWRDVKVRYKQTVLGVTWVVLQPLLLMLIFTFVFGRLAGVASEGAPYHLFVLSGLVPWLLFSSVLVQVSNSLISDSRIITKIYFPRLIVPLSASVSCTLDAAIITAMFAFVYFASGAEASLRLMSAPLWLIGTLVVALSFAIGLAALNAKYRDFRYVIPFFVQLLLFLTPVFYPASLIPESVRWIYGLNPMVLMVEGFRWSTLGIGEIPVTTILSAATIVAFVGTWSIRYFRRYEDLLADIL
jgi:lipopolysaccharide transport system permease protein